MFLYHYNKNEINDYLLAEKQFKHYFFIARNGNIVLEPIWRLQNGQGPSWKYAQAKVKAKGNYQVMC